MRKIILKEGPLVFLRNVLVMEILAAAFLYGISYLQNYEMLYKSWDVSNLIRYDIFLIIVSSVFQLVYVTLLFLSWYFSHFEITDREITRKSGLLFRRRNSVSLSDVVSVETYHSPLGRMMRHATILIHHATGRTTKIKNVLNAEEYVHVIKQIARESSGQLPTHSALYLIGKGEGLLVEFKETLRFDKRRKEVSKEMEKMVLKTIVAFLNAKGGTLIIGVSDSGEAMGLDHDYQTLPKKSRDGFENHLSQLIKINIGLSSIKYVSMKFEEVPSTSSGQVEGREVCVISVGESHRPVYLRNGDRREDFFVRVGNSTQPFSMSEAEEYIKTRWQ